MRKTHNVLLMVFIVHWLLENYSNFFGRVYILHMLCPLISYLFVDAL